MKEEGQRQENKSSEEKLGGIGEIIGRIFKFVGKFIKKKMKNIMKYRY